jgi:DegV family protein with EDD domain
MTKIAITTDSNSGVLPNELKDKGVFVLPMPFLVGNETYFENVNLDQEGFYKLLENDVNVSTSQPSVGDLTDFWNEILKEYDEIVHFPMSSGLSKSMETARIFAKDFNGKVTVVDNHKISVMLKESIYDAIYLRDSGKTSKEIQEICESMSEEFSTLIAVDTMKYLKKGGRVTKTAAMIGTLLGIKPVLRITPGQIDRYETQRSMKRAKECMKKAIQSDIDGKFNEFYKKGELVISVAHTNNYQAAEEFALDIKETFPDITFRFCEPLSLSVSCHIGPGALAVSVMRRINK